MPRVRLPGDRVVMTVQDVREIAATIALEVATKLDDDDSEHVIELIFEHADRLEALDGIGRKLPAKTIPALAAKPCRGCGRVAVIRGGFILCPPCGYLAPNAIEWNEKYGVA